MSRDSQAILLIDDESDLVSSVGRILRLDGYHVDTASTIAESLNRRDWGQYFAILLDRRLPDGSAEDVLPQIKRLAPHAAIIVVTGHADLGSSLTALRFGAEDYLIKPVDPDSLRARLSRIAELRRTEEELRREREFATSILETAQAIVLVLDTEGRIVRFNPFMEILSGYDLREVQGKDWFDIFLPEDERTRGWQVFQQSLNGTPAKGIIGPILTKHAHHRDIAWWDKRLQDDNGNVVGLVCTGHDVTDLKEAQRKLMQAERLAAIGEAMAGLAHESRNALQRSQVCLEMLADRVEDQPEALEFIQSIQKAQDDLHRLYEEVREFAAPIQLNPQRADVGEIVRQAWRHLSSIHQGRQAHLQEYSASDDLRCDVDPFALGRVFQNILENSLAACGDPVEIAVRYSHLEGDGRPALVVALRDNGPGLSPEQRRRIFESFYTTKTKGTGLGMAIAQRIVEAHNGRIAVNHAYDRGAEFLVTLPRRQG